MIVYKYISSRYAEAFASGIIRISPAHTFRQSDGFEDGRSDADELRKKISLPGGTMQTNSIESPILNEFITIIRGGKRVENFEIEVIGDTAIIVDNALLCCFSTTMSTSIDEKMKATFAADSVFEVSDIAMFGKIITEECFSTGVGFRHGFVHYTDKKYVGKGDYNSVDHFRKSSVFSWQSEYRLVWSLKDIDEPILINVPKLSGLVRRIE